ncbi:MAG: hypothetical protein BRC25_01205 [Parcubacteria group bacterium SW_6_46_9]|nr:MAG: hypothetical protein BRC25_01205 [Parcubacteria group bacterium SW_6_46_9]
MPKSKCVYIIFLFVFLPLFAGALTVSAPGDPWFAIEEIDVSVPNSLPDSVQVNHFTSDDGVIFRVKNTGSEPLYISADSLDDNSNVDITKKPPFDSCNGYSGPYKLVDGTIYECTNYEASNAEVNWRDANVPQKGGWEEFDLKSLDSKFHKAWKRGDNRPNNVSIPKPVNFSFQVLYGGRLHTISGMTSFALNKDYNPTARQDTLEAAHEDWPPNSNSSGILYWLEAAKNTITNTIQRLWFE